MPVAIQRTCPHCQTPFTAQRGDRVFCSHNCTLAFNFYRRHKHGNAPRSDALIEAYRTHRAYQGREAQVQ